MEEKILIIDDDVELAIMLRLKLECQEYVALVANSGVEGLRLAYETHPNLILMDIMMPGMDGYEVCRRLRDLTDVPIMVMSGKISDDDIIRAFRVGADDYVKKPFNFGILLERIQVILKRSKSEKIEVNIYEDDELKIDLNRQNVNRAGQAIHLTPTEFRLLSCLVRQPDCVVTQDELLTDVWGPNYANATPNLAVYIHYLRQKLNDEASDHHYIRNRWGVGYWFATKPSHRNSASIKE